MTDVKYYRRGALDWPLTPEQLQSVNSEVDALYRALNDARSTIDSAVGVVAGTYGDATDIPQLTVNAQGFVTSIVNVPIGSALTSVNDTNVTLTLGGTPATALVRAASLTLGWSGQLGLSRGGSAANLSGTGGAGQYVKQATLGGAFTVGTIPASDIVNGAALTRVNDTNVTLTLGGTPTTALLVAASITAGWTGQLSLSRGGTNNDLSASGGAHQVLQQLSAGSVITVGQLAVGDISGNPASGTGTTNKIIKWLSGAASTLTDSIISESSGAIGISTASPQTTLHVTSGNNYAAAFTGAAGTNLLGVGARTGIANGSPAIQGFSAAFAAAVSIALQPEGGGVSIGNAVDPGATNLSVVGSVTAASVSTTGNVSCGSTLTVSGETLLGSIHGVTLTYDGVTKNNDVAIGSLNTVIGFTNNGTNTGNAILTGMSGGTTGRMIMIMNRDSQGLQINFGDTGSLAVNRFISEGSSGPLTLFGGQMTIACYDSATGGWRIR